MNTERERWDGADRYEQYMGRWSRQVAPRFVAWLDPQSGSRWIDVGCGTGALSTAVIETTEPLSVVGVDPSPAYLDVAVASFRDPRFEGRVGDATTLPVEDSSAEFVVSGLALNFVGEPAAAVAEMWRAAVPGGRVGSYVWDYADGMEFIRQFWDAAIAADPAAATLDQGSRFPICAPDALRALHQAAGLRDVVTAAVEIPTVFADLDDLWLPFLGGQGATGHYCSQLTEEQQDRIRDELAARVPSRSDGSIALTARAWAVAGTKGR